MSQKCGCEPFPKGQKEEIEHQVFVTIVAVKRAHDTHDGRAVVNIFYMSSYSAVTGALLISHLLRHGLSMPRKKKERTTTTTSSSPFKGKRARAS